MTPLLIEVFTWVFVIIAYITISFTLVGILRELRTLTQLADPDSEEKPPWLKNISRETEIPERTGVINGDSN